MEELVETVEELEPAGVVDPGKPVVEEVLIG